MTKKILGKITSAEFGFIGDYPFMMGLQLRFSLADGSSIGDGGKYTVNMNKDCQWKSMTRSEGMEWMADNVKKILNDAKADHVSKLINKPVEVTIEANCFKDFRILTEVL